MKLEDLFDLPAKGSFLFIFKGGPLDKTGLSIDVEISPFKIVADGHVYERVIETLRDQIGAEVGRFLSDPDEPFEGHYQYKGKTA